MLDELDVAIDEYRRNPELLNLKGGVDQGLWVTRGE